MVAAPTKLSRFNVIVPSLFDRVDVILNTDVSRRRKTVHRDAGHMVVAPFAFVILGVTVHGIPDDSEQVIVVGNADDRAGATR